MSCFKKNNGQREFSSWVGLLVILAVFFMTSPCVMASSRSHGAKSGRINTPSAKSDKALYCTNGLKKTFDRLDSNSDGYLTVADYQPDRSKLILLAGIPFYRKIIQSLILERRKKWYTYAGLDTNGDGKVEFKEFIVPKTNHSQRMQP